MIQTTTPPPSMVPHPTEEARALPGLSLCPALVLANMSRTDGTHLWRDGVRFDPHRFPIIAPWI